MEQEIFYNTIEENGAGLEHRKFPIDVLQQYNNYVVTFFETHDNGSDNS